MGVMNMTTKTNLKPILVYEDAWKSINSIKIARGYKKMADVIDYLLAEVNIK